MTKLTDEQWAELKASVTDILFEDASQDEGYMIGIIQDYVDLMRQKHNDPVSLASLISDDEEYLKLCISFDPKTGKPWD